MNATLTRRTVLLTIALNLAALCGCAERAIGPVAKTAPQPVRLRVLTYNILHGAGMDDKVNLARTAEVIKRVNPDLVALQEVDKLTARSGRVDEAAELGKMTGMHAVFGNAMAFDGGEYGEAVLSRLPFESTESHKLPQMKNREPREALEVRVRVPAGAAAGETIVFVSTHWDHLDDDANRLQQGAYLGEWAAKQTAPVILAGDWNDKPGSRALATLGGGWLDTTPAAPQFTWPSDKPEIRLDYIFARPTNRWRLVSAEVVNEPMASDHRPVRVVLELVPASHP